MLNKIHIERNKSRKGHVSQKYWQKNLIPWPSMINLFLKQWPFFSLRGLQQIGNSKGKKKKSTTVKHQNTEIQIKLPQAKHQNNETSVWNTLWAWIYTILREFQLHSFEKQTTKVCQPEATFAWLARDVFGVSTFQLPPFRSDMPCMFAICLLKASNFKYIHTSYHHCIAAGSLPQSWKHLCKMLPESQVAHSEDVCS